MGLFKKMFGGGTPKTPPATTTTAGGGAGAGAGAGVGAELGAEWAVVNEALDARRDGATQQPLTWICSSCTYENSTTRQICEICERPRQSAPPPSTTTATTTTTTTTTPRTAAPPAPAVVGPENATAPAAGTPVVQQQQTRARELFANHMLNLKNRITPYRSQLLFLFGLFLFDIIQAYIVAVFLLAPPSTCEHNPQYLSPTLFLTLGDMIAAPRALFAPGSFVYDMYWLLIVCGTAFLISLISMLRGTPFATAILRVAVAIRRPGVFILASFVSICLFAEYGDHVRNESPFAAIVLFFGLSTFLLGVAQSAKGLWSDMAVLAGPMRVYGLGAIAYTLMKMCSSCYLVLSTWWWHSFIALGCCLFTVATVIQLLALTPSTLTSDEKKTILAGILVHVINWRTSFGSRFSLYYFAILLLICLFGYSKFPSRTVGNYIAIHFVYEMWSGAAYAALKSPYEYSLSNLFVAVLCFNIGGLTLVVRHPESGPAGTISLVLLAYQLFGTLLSVIRIFSHVYPEVDSAFGVCEAVLYSMLAIVLLFVAVLNMLNNTRASTYLTEFGLAFHCLLFITFTFSPESHLAVQLLRTVVTIFGCGVVGELLKSSAFAQALIALLNTIDMASLARHLQFLSALFTLARPLYAIATAALFGAAVAVSPFHISALPHLLACVAAIAVALSITGETWHIRALEQLGNRAYAHIHLGVWDMFGNMCKLIYKLTPVLVNAFKSGLQLLDVVSRLVWPSIRSVTRAIFHLFTHRASLMLVGSMTTILFAYLIHENKIDLRSAYVLMDLVLLPFIAIKHLIFGAIPALLNGLTHAFSLFFSDLDPTRAPLLRFAQQPGFSLLYFTLMSLRSRFRELQFIRTKFFVLPLFCLGFGLAVSRAWLAPLIVLATIWLTIAYTLYQYDLSRNAAEMNAIRRNTAFTPATAAAAGVAAGATATQPPAVSTKVYEAEECPICMGGFDAENARAALTCGHQFHGKCIEAWFTRGNFSCPNCRMPQPNAGWRESIRYSVF